MRVLAVLWCTTAALAAGGPAPDTDHDGFPDQVELTSADDRQAFRRWFVAIGVAQYFAPVDDWTERDCSGLVRYAFQEALQVHDSAWRDKYEFLLDESIPDVRQYSYPVPLLSRALFRIRDGVYSATDWADGTFVGSATAQELMYYNTVLLGYDLRLAQPGDMLFYVHPYPDGLFYHSMIYVGQEPRFGPGQWVVYHTGPIFPDGSGEVRLVTLDQLAGHPDRTWAARAGNPYFLGFRRWKILD